MTREEAIQVLKEISTTLKSWSCFTSYPQAIEMAIDALSADRPSEERLLQEIKHLKEQNNQLSELYTALSVNDCRDVMEWEWTEIKTSSGETFNIFECSGCGGKGDPSMNFCPHCGAAMKGDNE